MIGIYKITNKLNQKCYVGQSVNIEQRWAKHRTDSHNLELRNDIQKLGIQNFTFEVLEECKINELDQREKYWIQYFNSYEEGYNLTLGGSGNNNPLNLDYEAIYQRFLETNSMSKTAEEFNCSVTPVRNALRQHGIDYSDVEKEKPVEQIDPITLQVIKVYPSIAEAGKALGVTYSAISLAANGTSQTSCGYYWRFVGETKQFDKKTIKKWKRKIAQYNLDTNELITTFSSAADAARSLGKDGKNGGSQIISACKGIYKQAYGYKWKYLD